MNLGVPEWFNSFADGLRGSMHFKAHDLIEAASLFVTFRLGDEKRTLNCV